MEFLKNNRRFSLKLDGTNIGELEYSSKCFENGNEIVTVYDFGGGFRLTNKAKKIDGDWYDFCCEQCYYEWIKKHK